MSVSFARGEREAMTLSTQGRARLAARRWESLPEQNQTNVVMTPELEVLLDEGMESLERAKTTNELRRRPVKLGPYSPPNGPRRISANSS